jgi:hypothetical protein
MTDWLKTHVFIAAWASPIIALIGMIIRKPTEGSLNWSRMMIYVGFLTCLAVAVTPGVEAATRGFAAFFVAMGFGYLIVDSGRWRS